MVDSTNLPEVDINAIATDLNNKMDRDGVNATASVCVESSHDENGNWYRVYSDGWCEQGGITTGNTQTIQFLKAYANTNYVVFANIITSSDTYAYNGQVNIKSKATTSFSFPASSSQVRQWIAKGYIR